MNRLTFGHKGQASCIVPAVHSHCPAQPVGRQRDCSNYCTNAPLQSASSSVRHCYLPSSGVLASLRLHKRQIQGLGCRLPPVCVSIDTSLQAEELPLESVATLPSKLKAVLRQLSALYRFSRPHTMLGTAVSVTSVSLLALGAEGLTASAAMAMAQALSSALLMNICIVGINQIYDVEIDRVNKPYLPLPAGDFTPSTATALVVATGAVSLAIGVAAASPPLLATLGGSLLLGIAYSTDLPLLRWKRHPVAAAACILAVRAVLVQLGFFFHMQLVLGAPALRLTRPVAFATAFMLLFSVVIALFKDIPDVKGDKGAGVRTLSVRWGQRRVFWACIALLEVAYGGAVAVGLCSGVLWSRAATVGAHAAMGALVYWRARRTDLSSSKAIYACYMDVWKALYAEYLLLPLFR